MNRVLLVSVSMSYDSLVSLKVCNTTSQYETYWNKPVFLCKTYISSPILMAHYCFEEGCTETHYCTLELAMGSAAFVSPYCPLRSRVYGKSDISRWVFEQRLKKVISIARLGELTFLAKTFFNLHQNWHIPKVCRGTVVCPAQMNSNVSCADEQ